MLLLVKPKFRSPRSERSQIHGRFDQLEDLRTSQSPHVIIDQDFQAAENIGLTRSDLCKPLVESRRLCLDGASADALANRSGGWRTARASAVRGYFAALCLEGW